MLWSGESTETALPIPESAAMYVMVDIVTEDDGLTRAFLRRTLTGYEVVGLERDD